MDNGHPFPVRPGAHTIGRDPAFSGRSGERNTLAFEDVFRQTAAEGGASAKAPRQAVRLGTLTEKSPTVSHLLMRNPEYREQCWDIVHDPVNRNKPFRDMDRGATVWLDPESREIVVGREPFEAQDPGPDSPARPDNGTLDPHRGVPLHKSEASSLSTQDLNRAVTEYRGTPYERLDCFELVVRGLKDLGVDYSGRQGLQHQLMQQARQEERAPNAYLTGEGLIRSLGAHVFRQDLSGITRPESTARELMRDLDGQLEPGMILSLSTEEGGHTGVISRQEGRWTFINSGRIQNAVDGADVRHGVAEEDLLSEMAVWLERAREKGQSLSVSVGRLSPEKVGRYLAPEDRLSNRV